LDAKKTVSLDLLENSMQCVSQLRVEADEVVNTFSVRFTLARRNFLVVLCCNPNAQDDARR
jgi:hypothetical protein